ncbi:DUF6093 family protein [Nocardioides sp. SYSU DS0663]|uniref:DUF6093 family protein n=1 Tax=Nocardioides sp. SYSU DS0663 TaxID=3416445 RepID=UPI003F4B77C5
MPRRLHTGRPGWPGPLDGWAEVHRPVVAATHTAPIGLRKPGTTQAWSDAEEQMVAVLLDPYWTGTARVQALATQARVVVTAGDTETVASYLVAVDAAAVPAEGDLVDVSAGSGDPLLDGRTLRVLQVLVGTERMERDLFCTLND